MPGPRARGPTDHDGDHGAWHARSSRIALGLAHKGDDELVPIREWGRECDEGQRHDPDRVDDRPALLETLPCPDVTMSVRVFSARLDTVRSLERLLGSSALIELLRSERYYVSDVIEDLREGWPRQVALIGLQHRRSCGRCAEMIECPGLLRDGEVQTAAWL